MYFMKTILFLTTAVLVNSGVAVASSLRNSRSLALQLIAGFEASTDVSDVVRTLCPLPQLYIEHVEYTKSNAVRISLLPAYICFLRVNWILTKRHWWI
jgi:hypothetical protein